MDWQPLTYHRCSYAEANLANQLLCKAGGNVQLAIDGQVYHVRLAAYNRGYRAAMILRCRIGDCMLSVYLSDSALDALLVHIVPSSSLKALPEDLQFALLSATIFPLTNTLKKQLGAILTLEGFEWSDGATANGLFVQITSAQITSAQTILVTIDRPLPAPVADWLGDAGQAPIAKDYAWLTLPVNLELGHASLTVSDIQSLQSGDIVLLSTSYLSDGRLRVSISNHFSCLARISGNDLIVQTQLEKIMEEESKTPENAGEVSDAESSGAVGNTVTAEETSEATAPRTGMQTSPDISDLPMDVLFVAGRLNITLKELQRIRPGYVFDLKKDASKEIEIRVNGAEIASGELVEVDDRAGVRVLECK